MSKQRTRFAKLHTGAVYSVSEAVRWLEARPADELDGRAAHAACQVLIMERDASRSPLKTLLLEFAFWLSEAGETELGRDVQKDEKESDGDCYD